MGGIEVKLMEEFKLTLKEIDSIKKQWELHVPSSVFYELKCFNCSKALISPFYCQKNNLFFCRECEFLNSSPHKLCFSIKREIHSHFFVKLIESKEITES